MSTTHTLFYISTSCLESENQVLQDYVLPLPLQRQVQQIILGYSEPTSAFTSRKSIYLCISGKLNDEIINGFFTFLERFFSDTNCLPAQCYLDSERKRCSGVVKLAFGKEDVMSNPLYIPVNENENHQILLIGFPKAKLVVSYDRLQTNFKRKTSMKILTFLTSYCERRNPTNTPRVFPVETTWKRSFPCRFYVEYTWSVCKKSKYEFSVMETWYSGWQEEAKYD